MPSGIRIAALALFACFLATSAQARPKRIYLDANGSDVRLIPNPAGTWRIAQSCAHRLAAYWNLGGGLDKVSLWPRKFPRVSTPAVHVAAVRRDLHHVLGIVGGGPGAWRVVDFNSGGHLNREYTVASFSGYFFVDPFGRAANYDTRRSSAAVGVRFEYGSI